MSIPNATTHANLIEARLRSNLPTWFPGGKVDQLIRKLSFQEVKDLDRFSPTYAYRARFVGGYYSLIVPENESIARMSGITTNPGALNIPSRVPPP